MAKNLADLDKQLAALELRRSLQVGLIKSDMASMQQALKPGNLVKAAFKDLFSSKASQGIVGGAAGVAGTLLLNGLLKKPTAISLLTGVLTSEPVIQFLKEDKLGLGKLVDKVKSFVGKGNKEDGEQEPETGTEK